jgi:hypothetical protein
MGGMQTAGNPALRASGTADILLALKSRCLQYRPEFIRVEWLDPFKFPGGGIKYGPDKICRIETFSSREF